MELGKVGGLVGVVVLVLGVLFGGYLGFGDEGGSEGIRVASFNGQIFGDSKIEKIGVDYYVDLVRGYDLFFLLEIRDKDGSSFDEVCSALASYNYSCLVSERAGRGISKEQVGVVWRDGINVTGFGEVDDELDLFEREPFWVEFSFSDDRFYIVHLKPDDVVGEMGALEEIVGESDTVLIGDFNADCDYYDAVEETHFDSWNWVIGDDVDTTTGATDCAYDRVVVSGDVGVLGSGVVEISEDVSDHHLVWVELG